MRIGIYCPGLFWGRGGTERFCARLSAWLVAKGHDCVVIKTSACPLERAAYELSPQVGHATFHEDDAGANLALLKQLRLDVLCALTSTRSLLTAVGACNNSDVPLLVSERSCPWLMENDLWNRRERLAAFLAADRIHLLSPGYSASLPGFLRSRATVIANSAPIPEDAAVAPASQRHKIILGVGRLEDNLKRFSLLIGAFARLQHLFPDWKLIVCGEGPSHAYYETLIDAYGLAGKAVLAGLLKTKALEGYLRAAAVFCLPSLHEGIPNALLEAQAYGLPAVGFASCEGVNDIIRDGETGILVREVSSGALASALARLMSNLELRRSMALAARKNSLNYAPEVIFPQWEELLRQTAACKGQTRLHIADSEEEAVWHALRHVLSEGDELTGKKRLDSVARYLRSRMMKIR